MLQRKEVFGFDDRSENEEVFGFDNNTGELDTNPISLQ